MKCPKCNYVSFDYLDSCKKCGYDLSQVREERNIMIFRPGSRDIFTDKVKEKGPEDIEMEKGSEEDAKEAVASEEVKPVELEGFDSESEVEEEEKLSQEEEGEKSEVKEEGLKENPASEDKFLILPHFYTFQIRLWLTDL